MTPAVGATRRDLQARRRPHDRRLAPHCWCPSARMTAEKLSGWASHNRRSAQARRMWHELTRGT